MLSVAELVSTRDVAALRPRLQIPTLRGGAASEATAPWLTRLAQLDMWEEFVVLLSTWREDPIAILILWVVAATLYLGTLHWCDEKARSVPEHLQKPLPDLGFAAVPVQRGKSMSYATDASAMALTLWTAYKCFAGSPAEKRQAWYVIFCVAVGNFFSTTLHTVTLIPASEPNPAGFSTDLPLMGGKSDKLMSNHTFCVGLVLQMLVRLGYCHPSVCLLGVLTYSTMMLSSRAHYSVDIVLAWWALAVAHAYAPMV